MLDYPMYVHELLGSIAAALVILGFAPYIYDTIKGRTQPHLYSWIIWSLIQGTGVWIILAEGGGWGGAGLAAGTILCITVALLSLRYGTTDITRLDTLFLIAGLTAFAGYAFAREPYLSLGLVVLTDFLGFVPTVRKAYAAPESETKTTWMLFAASNVFSLAALETVTLLTVTYSGMLLIVETTLVIILFARSRAARSSP